MSFFYIINLIKLKLCIVIDCPSYTFAYYFSLLLFLDAADRLEVKTSWDSVASVPDAVEIN